MRKAVALLVLVAFVVLALAVPAFAGPAPPKYYQATLTGKVVYSKIEVPHYELVVSGPMLAPPPPGSGVKPPVWHDQVYILTGPFNFKTYEGKLVRVTGQVVEGLDIYQRGSALSVTRIEPLLAPKAPVVRPVGR